MLIIGLVGGTELNREVVADELAKIGKSRLGVFALRSPADGTERAALLKDIILNFDHGLDDDTGLVLSHVTTPEEANLIRNKGGHLLHVQGSPSKTIAIHHSDLMVTAKRGGDRHYLDPLEALSEISTRYARQRAKAKVA